MRPLDWQTLSLPKWNTDAGDMDACGRRLSVRTQAFVLALAAGAVAFALLLSSVAHAILGGNSSPVDTQNPAQPGTFRPTAIQMAELTILPVAAVPFRSQQIAEGAIGLDDERSTAVYSPYSGRVTKLYAALGDRVTKGTPLMAVEASEVVQAQSDLVATLATLATAEAQLTLAESSANRQKELYEAKATALKDFEQTQVELVNARSSLRGAEIAAAAAHNRLRILGKSDVEIAALERTSTVRTMNPEAVVAAPISGTVMLRQVGLGQNLQAGNANPVFVIGDLSKVWLIANVRESELAHVEIGQPVEVRVPAYPDRIFSARITTIAPAVDPSTHRLPVRAEVDNPDGALKPEMFAGFTIATGDERDAPGIPESAVVSEGEATHVWVALADGSLALRDVKLGRHAGRVVEVLSGLKIGERVATQGPLFIDQAAKTD